MKAEAIYEIVRYRENEGLDELIDRIQLTRDPDGSLTLRHDDGRKTSSSGDDARAVIAANQDLHGVRPNERTRVRGTKEIRAELPLLLRALDTDVYGEDYEVWVDDEPWGVVSADDRMWVLPSDGYELNFIDRWASASFIETGSMTSGLDRTALGMITPTLVADFCDLDGESPRITISRRDDDATTIANWLLNGNLSEYFGTPELLVQLFTEAAKGSGSVSEISGSRLAAGIVLDGDFGTSPTALWSLDLELSADVRDRVLDRLRERGGCIAEIVEGATNPDSALARARAVELKELNEQDGLDDDSGDEDDDWDDEDDDPDAPWNQSAVERLPRVISPGDVPVRLWRRFVGESKPIAFDFLFRWGGERTADWSYGVSPDNADVSPSRFPSFQGTATWTDGVNVQLTYSSLNSRLSGETKLSAAAPMMMNPESDEYMKRPMSWVDLALKITGFLKV